MTIWNKKCNVRDGTLVTFKSNSKSDKVDLSNYHKRVIESSKKTFGYKTSEDCIWVRVQNFTDIDLTCAFLLHVIAYVECMSDLLTALSSSNVATQKL